MKKAIIAITLAVALVATGVLPATAQTALAPLKKFALTSASATACTTIFTPGANQTSLKSIVNTGPAITIFPQFFDDTACTVQANVLFGDFATLTIGPGQILTFNVPLSKALSYRLSGALSSTQNLIITVGF
ncbi:MAG: hypothetical protein JWO85_1515 [Candidatus Eremiobacteraeota bacterium]|nr:hypothetical protein [Candidatus Eremiobacteraeota bacterium]